jgi:hypothetical protein
MPSKPTRAALVLAVIFALAGLGFGQANTWTQITGNDIGSWRYCGLLYAPNTNEYIVTMGNQNESGADCPFNVQVFTHTLGKWINALPHDTLYGKWADSTGYAFGNGRTGNQVFGTYYWAIRTIEGYLRVNNGAFKTARAYQQFCYNSDDGKFYYYINNTTFTYDPATRRWDTLSVNTHPNAGAAEGYLKWSSLCYDPVNQEIVLFGGGAIDASNGSPGTWILDPATSTWTKQNPAVEPGPRAHAPLVYDPVNQVIVMFGGDHLDHLLNETWVYDCATRTWSKQNPAVRPSPRAGHAMLYMPKSRKIVMMGGYRYTANQSNEFEMWRYDAAANDWSLIKRFGSGDTWPKLSPIRPAFAGVVTVDTNDVVIALADTAPSQYYFTPRTYRMTCDPTVTDASGTTTYGMTADTVELRGGWTNPSWFLEGVTTPDTAANEAFLRTLPLHTWTALSPPKKPQSAYRAWGTTVLDPDRDLFLKWSGGHVAHCGTDVPEYSPHNNRWNIGYIPEWPLEYNGDNQSSPANRTFNGRPFMPMHTVKSYAYDVNLHRMVHAIFMHTHIYNPDIMDWDTTVHIHNPFGAGYNTGLCATARGAYCLWYANYTARSFLFDADSLKWDLLPQTGTLPGFYADNSTVVYDSMRDRIIAVQGRSSEIARVYEYVFSSGQANRLYPADSSLATGDDRYRDCAYLPNLDIILFQIRQGSNNLALDLANNQWVQVPISGFVSTMNDRGTGMMYDPKRNLVWISDHNCNNYAARLDSATVRAELNRKAHERVSLTVSPNPFYPAAALILPSIPGKKKGLITLRIYSADGRCVADLSNEAAHARKVAWHASNLASGVYVVKFSAGGKIWKKKAILVR